MSELTSIHQVPGSTTNALYAGGFDKDKNAYIAKLYWSYPLQVGSFTFLSSYTPLNLPSLPALKSSLRISTREG